MPTIKVGPGSDLELQQIADALGKSKKVVVVTGAGISTNCGIPDFRSENGLYSMIQAQYDAALLNPPWEQSNTFDIDDRPKKKRKTWFYEVVAPDGKVVDVIDPDLEPAEQQTRRSSRSRSTNTTNSRSNTPQPTETPALAPGTQAVDAISVEIHSAKEEPLISSTSAATPYSRRATPTTAPDRESSVINKKLAAAKEAPRRSSRSRSMNPAKSRAGSPRTTAEGQSNTDDEGLRLIDQGTRQSSLARSTDTNDTRASTPLSAIESQEVDTFDEHPETVNNEPRPSSRSRSTNTTNSRSSTPKSIESSLTSLSSNTPELPDSTPQNSSELSLNADQSTLSQTSENLEPSTQPSTSRSTGLSRTTSDVSTSRTLPNLKGRDLFDSMIWSDPFTTSIFYMFISSLREKIQNVSYTTETHRFLRVLRDGGKLVRNYTQNIDMLEQREGLCQELEKGPGAKGRFNARAQREARKSGIGADIDQNGGCEVVPLHGSLQWLRCSLCGKPSSWDEPANKSAMLSGTAPDCGPCTTNSGNRTSRGRRGLAIGRLRPDIVLYGEEHPHSNLISPIVTHDLGLGPDILLIMGTSLRVHGLKVMIREFAKAVHTKGGKVVFVNQTKPSESIWGEFIDYWVEWDCDEWVMDLRDRREDIWTGVVEENTKETTETTKRRRPQALRDDKLNGAYLTFKILDTLSRVRDESGGMASRFLYWPAPASRVSNISLPDREQQTKAPVKKGQSTKKNSKSAPIKKTGAKPNKRKSEPEPYKETEEDRKNLAYIVSKIWEDLRKKAPDLSAIPPPPPELRIPFSKFTSNKALPDYLTPFAFSSTSNHIPNVGTWPLDKMNLVSLPPSGSTIPIHTPKSKPKTEEKPKPQPRPNHGYGTRASRRFSSAETIVVDRGETDVQMEQELPAQQEPMVQLGEEQEQEDTIVAKSEDPMTPVSSRIKRNCSIGALVSSSPEQWHDAMEVVS
ncbi:uncharacterized protein PAC_17675 [Phialocephala subalpina]|uniref:Deacetylase sirtuin-type domain-containing protein n=1 Tax=Phialocephala subalpina TaxID=576137 RepID=A0A1L7XRT7_9HELO|nr:uncharacterized protein PAC_17675 [Phialocephala subalpina]